ncbi:MAG: ComF family protein [Synergistaceae bacterium]|nr:ComF family protein [Synergistaceae bacterium]
MYMLRWAGKYFLHLIWPSSCEVCGRIGRNPCESCGRIMREREIIASNARGFYRIFTDEIITRHFDNLTVYSALHHHDIHVKKVIHSFKEEGRKDIGRPLGVCMARSFGETEADYIMPAPLRMNSERRYNQTTELAKGMCDYWGVELLDVSERTRERPHQMSLGAKERKNNIAPDDFRFKADIKGLRVALVDDVCTTGYTLTAFAEACERAGAVVICAYTLSSSTLEKISKKTI